MYKYKKVWINNHTTKQDEHRFLMEQKLGRKLSFDEVIHHKDGNGKNNDLDNLEVMSRSQHSKIHCKMNFKGLRRKDYTMSEATREKMREIARRLGKIRGGLNRG